MSKPALEQLSDIARLAVRTGAVVNFWAQSVQRSTGQRCAGRAALQRGAARSTTRSICWPPRGWRPAFATCRFTWLPSAISRPSTISSDTVRLQERLRELVVDRPACPTHARRAADAAPRAGSRLPLGPLRIPLRRLAAQMPQVGGGLHEINLQRTAVGVAVTGKSRRAAREDPNEGARIRATAVQLASPAISDRSATATWRYGLFGEEPSDYHRGAESHPPALFAAPAEEDSPRGSRVARTMMPDASTKRFRWHDAPGGDWGWGLEIQRKCSNGKKDQLPLARQGALVFRSSDTVRPQVTVKSRVRGRSWR